jgi:hypothetical protein
MASHNTKPGFVFHRTPPAKNKKDEAADSFRLTLSEDELSIAGESGSDCDPYNNTGQQITLKQHKRRNK